MSIPRGGGVVGLALLDFARSGFPCIQPVTDAVPQRHSVVYVPLRREGGGVQLLAGQGRIRAR
mgnify:CR=1 FL=1